MLLKTDASKACLEDRLNRIAVHAVAWSEEVDLTVVEGPAYGKPNAAIAMGQVSGAVRLALWRADRPFVVVAPGVVKKFATGRGNATKEDMHLAARPFFGKQKYDHNQADALFLSLYGYENYEELVE